MTAGQWVGVAELVLRGLGVKRGASLACLGMCVLFFASTTHANSLNAIEEPVTRRHHQRHHEREREREENGYCAPYSGKVCKEYLTGQVWYSLDDPTGGWKNEQVTTALWDELISDLTGLCREAAEVSS